MILYGSMRRALSCFSVMVLAAGPLIAAGDGPSASPAVENVGQQAPNTPPQWSCRILMPADAPESNYVTNTWPGGIVPYVFHANVTADNQQFAVDAMAIIEAVPNVGIDFVPHSGQTNYLQIQDASGNSAAVGVFGPAQPVNIHDWNVPLAIVHELMHALGFWHEHQRSDREMFVHFELANVESEGPEGCDADCVMVNYETGATLYGAYDFDSVMHYREC